MLDRLNGVCSCKGLNHERLFSYQNSLLFLLHSYFYSCCVNGLPDEPLHDKKEVQ